ncbi:hypothetical protein DPMN_101604 [Dreissena polymorpha]|uniref:Uncharacterized protein n=1 Tax=Dreissena polymorpha TaxID=45954 RepID=A0A9D4R8G5_DREPO|nr:hypothetical protein DPMN_101604 [Dreissena polymorpha]
MAEEESEQTAENKPEQTAENESAQTAGNFNVHKAANEPVPTSESEEVNESTEYVINEFVAAVYQQKWYIGKVIKTDQYDIKIDFMEERKQLFRWPTRKDKLWVKKTDVLCTIAAPIATGKSNIMFQLENNTRVNIQNLYEQY